MTDLAHHALPNRTAPNWWRSLGAALVVQAAFWLVLYPILYRATDRPETLAIEAPEVARLSSASLQDLAAATFEPVTLPHTECCEPGYRAFRFAVTLDDVPEQGLDLVPLISNDNLMTVVNGTVLRLDGRMDWDHLTYHGNNRSITQVPAGMLRPGANTFVLVAVRKFVPYIDMNPPLVGEHVLLRPILSKRAYMLGPYQDQSIAVGVVCAVLALLLLFRTDQRRFALWVFLLVLSWTLRNLYYRWVDPPYDGTTRVFLYFVLTSFLPVAWLNLANEWTPKPWPGVHRVSVLLMTLATLAFAWLLYGIGPAGYDPSGVISDTLGLTLGALAMLRLVVHLAREADPRYWEAALFGLILVLMAIEFYQQWRFDRSTGHLQMSLPFLLVAFVAAFIGRNIRLFRSMNEINQLLREQLTARENELAAQYARQGELLRRETLLDERRRVMGEMHDGIGGQLLSLLHASRHQALAPEALHDGLSEVVDELRLVIDSLDAVGSSINVAIGNFRQRMTPRLKAAGITLRYRNDLINEPTHLGPREVLHVCRIVQEAVTNALKHAHCDEIELTVAPSDDGSQLEIVVRDNGRGLDHTAGLGHGQDNMRRRAAAVGAVLTVDAAYPDRAAPGTAVRLCLPMQADPAAPVSG
ncbi:hypothetical protein C7S18_19995 [Ahniella affigens]|uniref:Histidine kinase/HSP90-like ATPase domain-containing protein n=1 Tax=Ahniella affigens TaxID=2021234 RepID=A0A2P1PWU8_9GAMM|nr:ATP-binding protein [Ahniella affigens]AVP99310.1 hypothetical protein C7S18_19995 [Ahniella affigens]